MGKVFHDDDGFCTRIVELVFQFAGGVQRVGVYHHQAGAQNGEDGDGVLQQIGHHHRNAVAFFQAEFVFQVSAELCGVVINVAIADSFSEITIGWQITEFFDAGVKDVGDGGKFVRVDFFGNAGRVTF